MRILHILDHSVPLHSGYSFRTLAILREQRALGWETYHLTSPKHGTATNEEETVEGWHFYRTTQAAHPARLWGIAEVYLMRRLERRIEQVAKNLRPHILHAHSPVLNAIPALRVGRKLGIPVVYEVRACWEDAAVDHGTTAEGSLRYRVSRALESWALARTDAVTTICEGLRQEIIGRGIPETKVTVVPNGVDPQEFTVRTGTVAIKSQLGLDDSVVLGFIGSFYGYEGLSLLLRSMPRLIAEEPRTCLLLVGGGREEARLKHLTGELGIADRVHFTGRVPHHETPRYYDAIDILVYPRLSMRLTELVTPLKPLEAMAGGRLLVGSDVGGHRELIRPGETGVLFEPGNKDALVTAVLDLLHNPDRWPVLRSNAVRYVQEERTWRKSVAQYQRVYSSALGL